MPKRRRRAKTSQQPIRSKKVNSNQTDLMEELESLRDFSKGLEAYANYLGGSPQGYEAFLQTHRVPVCDTCARSEDRWAADLVECESMSAATNLSTT